MSTRILDKARAINAANGGKVPHDVLGEASKIATHDHVAAAGDALRAELFAVLNRRVNRLGRFVAALAAVSLAAWVFLATR